ncbi:MAG: AtpZ/AtpI family protein [Saprospiraceae bacterium]|nr:AtpZ/AtpI family protein [Saprospiraceae bacterium]
MKDNQQQQPPLSHEVGVKEKRMMRARRKDKRSVWWGLGMFGLVGWSVVVPALLGAWLGHWLDKNHPATHSWTLTLLITGLALGCFNAWFWVQKENKEIDKDLNNNDK